MFKKMRHLLTLTAVSVALVFATTGCSLFETEVDKATKIIEAYQSGDKDAFMEYAGEDAVMELMLGSLDVKNADGMREVFQKVHEATKDMEFTVEDNEDSKDGYVNVTFKGEDYMLAFNDAMIAAIEAGGDAFGDMPGWMIEALENGGESTTMEVEMRIHSDGTLVPDFNDDFFYAITGGFYEYALWTMTTCTMDEYEDTLYMVALGDKLLVSLDEYYYYFEEEISDEEFEEYRELYVADYQGYQGIYIDLVKIDGGFKEVWYINYEVADFDVLLKLDFITEGSGDYISLDASIDNLEADGFKCSTSDFGSGVLYEK